MSHCDSSYALFSVSDKSGIEELATALVEKGVQLLSTGGTASALRSAGLTVIDVSEHTGAAEMMAGRVKTLHPTIHGGILGRRGLDDEVMQQRAISKIDFVIVNLYPFSATCAKDNVSFDEVIENIDIGGPAMVRSAAKNHAAVMVVTDPGDYDRVIESLHSNDDQCAALRFDLAVKAFEHTAQYDGMIAAYLGCRTAPHTHTEPAPFPRTLNRQWSLVNPLRYGENPHQRAAFYRSDHAGPGTIAGARLVQGKALSYNNVMDADAALECVRQFRANDACVIVKHANPCGVAVSSNQQSAYEKAYQTDSTSAFGGIIAFNRALREDTAQMIIEQQFVEVIVAPGISTGALKVLSQRENVRVLDCFSLDVDDSQKLQLLRPVSGGLLVQDGDDLNVTADSLQLVSERQPEARELEDLLFAWRVAKFVKSNAIVYARDSATVGVGAGQMSRVYSARIAGIKAADGGLPVHGAVMASDAFFPFRDGIDNAAEAGIEAVIQPGGSRNDDEVIAAANEHGMAMVFTGVRHFRH